MNNTQPVIHSLSDAKFSARILSSQDSNDVDSAIFDNGDNIKWEPVGNNHGNHGPIGMVSVPANAINEDVTNAVDAMIQKMEKEGLFVGSPITPLEAQMELAKYNEKNPSIFFLSNVRDKENKIGNITTADKGIGLGNIDSTMLAFMNSNKINNSLLFGTFGLGCKTTYKFSMKTIIASVQKNSDVVSFTVVELQEIQGDKSANLYEIV